jgi:hypothetical protein
MVRWKCRVGPPGCFHLSLSSTSRCCAVASHRAAPCKGPCKPACVGCERRSEPTTNPAMPRHAPPQPGASFFDQKT